MNDYINEKKILTDIKVSANIGSQSEYVLNNFVDNSVNT